MFLYISTCVYLPMRSAVLCVMLWSCDGVLERVDRTEDFIISWMIDALLCFLWFPRPTLHASSCRVVVSRGFLVVSSASCERRQATFVFCLLAVIVPLPCVSPSYFCSRHGRCECAVGKCAFLVGVRSSFSKVRGKSFGRVAVAGVGGLPLGRERDGQGRSGGVTGKKWEPRFFRNVMRLATKTTEREFVDVL